MPSKPGERSALYVVATPLGNLQDLSTRAVQVLRSVERVYAEDTRRSRVLLDHIGARPDLRSLHSHNEQVKLHEALEAVERGLPVALVSDAGTPAVSDPGAALVAAAHERGLAVVPIPGPSAWATAVSVAGFDEAQPNILFLGFLPTKGRPRAAMLKRVAEHRGVVVLFEGPHRVQETLNDLAAAQTERLALMGRELTKMHEELLRAPLGELAHRAAEGVIGEVTLVLGPLPPEEVTPPDEVALQEALERCLAAGMSRRDAVTAVAAVLGVPRKRVYPLAHQERDEDE